MYGHMNTPEAHQYSANRSFAAAANRLYECVTRTGLVANLKKLFGRQNAFKLFTLDEVTRQVHIQGQQALGEMTVDLDQIAGTAAEGRVQDFDLDFRPLQSHNKERWLGVAAAWISGRRLGRVKLVKVGDIYFIEDGHHRVSVARALGAEDIEAEVVQLLGTGTLTIPSGATNRNFAGDVTLQPATA